MAKQIECTDPHAIAEFEAPDDSRIQIVRMTFGKARLYIGPARAWYYDDGWCYTSPALAIAAAEAWDPETDPEPFGWFRHPRSGRRRPDGDPAREYVSE